MTYDVAVSRTPATRGRAARRRTAEPVAACPLYQETVELVGSRWTGAILWVLMSGPMRYSAIVEAVPGLSDRLCCHRLRELEAAGLVDRRVVTRPPAGVEYRLTPAGRDLDAALSAMGRWGHRWLRADPADATAFHPPHSRPAGRAPARRSQA